MAGVASNLDQVARLLRALATPLDFDAPGDQGGEWGRELALTVAEMIYERTVERQQGPGGSGLKALSPAYARSPRKRGLPISVGPDSDDNRADGHMMDLRNLLGDVVVEEGAVTMRYGANDRNRRIAEFFSVARPFYELDSEIEAVLDDLVRRRLVRRVAAIMRGD